MWNIFEWLREEWDGKVGEIPQKVSEPPVYKVAPVITLKVYTDKKVFIMRYQGNEADVYIFQLMRSILDTGLEYTVSQNKTEYYPVHRIRLVTMESEDKRVCLNLDTTWQQEFYTLDP